jgi:hypothetical protein
VIHDANEEKAGRQKEHEEIGQEKHEEVSSKAQVTLRPDRR